MLKKASHLTRPAPARQGAPIRRQGRSERRGEAYSVLYVEPLSDARTMLADFFSILLPAAHCRQQRSRNRRSFLVDGHGFRHPGFQLLDSGVMTRMGGEKLRRPATAR